MHPIAIRTIVRGVLMAYRGGGSVDRGCGEAGGKSHGRSGLSTTIELRSATEVSS